MIVLCIGGPLDGQRKEVRDRRGVIAGSYKMEPRLRPVVFRYDIERIAGRDENFWVAHPQGTNPDETMRKLLEGYRP